MSIKPIISRKHKYIYFFIPKNATMSVRRMLADHEGLESIDDLERVQWDDVIKYENYFWFTLTRDPFKRIVSAYADKVRAGSDLDMKKNYKPLHGKFNDFQSFLNYVIETPDKKIDWHLKSQIYYLQYHLCHMDFIGTVENFDFSIAKIKEIIGIDSETKKINSTNENIELTEAEKDLIYNRYYLDFIGLRYERN